MVNLLAIKMTLSTSPFSNLNQVDKSESESARRIIFILTGIWSSRREFALNVLCTDSPQIVQGVQLNTTKYETLS